MKALIVVRHGDHDGDRLLSCLGNNQIKLLAEAIKPFIERQNVKIVSSTAGRAVASAEALSEILDLPFTQDKVLWSDNNHWIKLPETLDVIKSFAEHADIIILVTHLEYAEILPAYVVQEISAERGTTVEYPYNTPTSKGEAWIVDIDKLTLTHLP